MKAWEIHPTGWKMIERADGQPAAHEVLIQVKATSLNYRDLSMVRRAAAGKIPQPTIALSDGAGEVLAVGAGVSRVIVGQRVAACFFGHGWIDGATSREKTAGALGGGSADGMLAERVILHEEALVAIPANLTYEEAAALPCAAVTVWHTFFTAGHLKPGDIVLLQGTGGVSIFGVQLAQLAGARSIITSSSDAKLERARALGASETINYKATPDWHTRSLAATAGVGVEFVLEVGGRDTVMQSVQTTRPGGTVSLIGGLTGFDRDPVFRDAAAARGVNVNEIYVGSRADFDNLNRAIALHHLKPVIDRVFPFESAPDALAHLESGAHFGKIVIRHP